MEDLPAFRAVHTIPANLSSSSLEIGQILGTDSDIAHSLLSESVTCASLSSDSLDSLHAFSPRALPTFTPVALGEDLKMFPTLLSGSGRKSGHCVVLAAPTVPRLRSMCKECLSITKWAEYSTTCQAPEHIPWESILKDGTKKWIPEGSIFSPEGFSYILSQARKGGTLHPRSDETDVQQENCVATISAPAGTFDSEVLGIMRELQSLRSYFAGTLQEDPDSNVDSLDRPSVPALVVSTSHVTFPLTLESCQTLSQQLPSTIASRRGKGAPPPLTIRTDNTSNWIEYPGIPSAFLGSPSSQPSKHYDEAEGVDRDKALCVEEMINNLRLQCSAMSLQSPSINDPSWNSRSAIPTFTDKKRSGGTFGVDNYAKGPLNPKKEKTQTPRSTAGRRNSGLPPPRYERQPNPPRTTSTMRASRCVGNIPALLQNSRKPAPATETIKQVALRSAMKENGIHRKNLLKSVRFALPQSEVQEDLTRPNPGSGSQEIPRIHEVKAARRNMNPKSSLHLTLPMFSVPKTKSTASPSTVVTGDPNTKAQVGPRHLIKGRKQSITISSPFRKIALSRGSVELKASSSESGTPAVGLRRAHTLGRHSLSQVIKVPMFCPKDMSKRTTISVDSAAFRRNSDDRVGREVFSLKKRRITDFGGLFNRFKQ